MTELTMTQLAALIQFANMRPNVTRDEMVAHLEKTKELGFNAAVIPMCWVPLGREMLKETPIKVATCVGLASGLESLHAKIAMIRECRALGADGVGYQPNMSFFLSEMYGEFQEEARLLVEAAGDMPVSAMLELGYIPEESDRRMAILLLEDAGVPWIENSSGFGPGAETAAPENIRLIKDTVSKARVKASGKILNYEQALALIEAGAELLGTSAGVEIMQGLLDDSPGS